MPRSSRPALALAVGALAALPSAALALTPTAATAAPARTVVFEAARVSLDGHATSLDDDGDARYDYSGRFSYAGTAATKGTLRSATRAGAGGPLTISGLDYAGSSAATITTKTDRFDCGLARQPPGFAPSSMSATVAFGASAMRVQWGVVTAAIRCPPHSPVWSFPALPAAATTLSYPLATVTRTPVGRLLRLKLDHRHAWREGSARHALRLRGSIWLRRVR